MATISMQDQNSTFPYAESVSTFGTCVPMQGGNGYGLVTRGLLWQWWDIWFNQDAADGVVTTWTASNTFVETTWDPCIGGVFGQSP